ncbi:L,D-transpeptidase family protein [Acuticoccus sp. MNP-M23]|uniref:L,D-transpeptidase family protein n=1 Tax=Acuticoccus sp. MNP-M23 TaxID=3072793 RepID=UPI002816603B|nr:L,D-transpeptidase family protein [Acuticoccus sp. MNP-M23]WMS44190.1 L,D-transpeptidase family protein [Acuticoccus sp. MNP-M23]
MTKWIKAGVLFAAMGVGAVPVAAEVPIPRLSPMNGVTVASLDGFALPAAVPLTLAEAISREAMVDVSFAVSEFYERRGFAPVWTAEKAADLRARLAEAAGDGLDPADYFVPTAEASGLSDAAVDVSLTEAALRYANDSFSGRLDPQAVSQIMTIEPPKLNEARFLRLLARTGDVPRLLERLHPEHPQFIALRDRLRVALESGSEGPIPVGRGPALKRGTKEVRVALLRRRLGATVMRGENPEAFDAGLEDAVREYQRSRGLSADGIVGPRTITHLDEGIVGDPTDSLISNMERWRWMPRDLGRHNVTVNIPAYRVRVNTDGKTIYDGKVIVGATGHPTPLFSDRIEHIVVNPYWNVPISIAANEMLGGIRANPGGYFARKGYEAVVNGRVVNPNSLSWHRGMLHKVRIRQKPGRGNALGAVKFLFPNKHAVYLHDTPSKSLFGRDVRALSHGCVRVDQPFAFAEALLSQTASLSGRRVEGMVGGKQKWLNLDEKIPVHLSYFTLEADSSGALHRFSDVYGFDARTQRALGL